MRLFDTHAHCDDLRIQNEFEGGTEGYIRHQIEHGVANIVNIGTSSVATVIFCDFFGDSGAAISTVVITVLVLIFCEVLPKSYAKPCQASNAKRRRFVFFGFDNFRA